MSDSESMSSYFEINGWPVWYEKFGTGSKPLLMIAGGIGTGRTDFLPQLEDEDSLDLDKFTIIAVEAPGWGRSRPPVRRYCSNHYNNDSECFHEVMKRLGYEKYSIIGWSDGAKVALLMATQYSESIESLVLISLSTYVSQSCAKFMKSTENIESWGRDRIQCYLRSYETKEEIQKLWTKFVDYVQYYTQFYPNDLYQNNYHLVQAPVLILHGDRDQMIDISQPFNVYKKLKNAKLHRFPLGAHDLHHKYTLQVKQLAEEHLLKD